MSQEEVINEAELPQGSTESTHTQSQSQTQSQTQSQAQSPGAGSTKSSNLLDVLNTEFLYYSAVLRNYAPILSREYDKVTTRMWVKKLFGPEYHSTVLKPKRNKYLLYLTITIYNDETFGIFRQEPPCGVLPELKEIPFSNDFPPAAWETEKQWTETLIDLPDKMKLSECYLHDGDCPQGMNNLSAVLDAEFQFFLWLARPYVALLPDPEEKTIAACWIQLLCGVAPEEGNCVEMKELRNDYMQILIGYVHDLRLEGPFRRFPPGGPVAPLSMWYEQCSEFDDPSEREAQQFITAQPLPDTGAFAYINVTGEMFGNEI